MQIQPIVAQKDTMEWWERGSLIVRVEEFYKKFKWRARVIDISRKSFCRPMQEEA